MRTYYRGHDALVTGQTFTWLTSPPRTVPVRHLQDIVVVHRTLGSAPSRLAQVACASVIVAAAWILHNMIFGYAATALAFGASLAMMVTYRRTRAHSWQIHATCAGRPVLLYASRDRQSFNQVSRGLIRAKEAAGPPASWYELAGA
jgi:orotate phosphoribosyltransferase-like protein